MGRRVATLAIVSAALAGGILTLRAALQGDGASGDGGLAGEAAPVGGMGAAALAPAAGVDNVELAPGFEAEGRSTARDVAASAAATGELDLERAIWIEGRVAFPLASPPDETLAVIAIPRAERTQDEPDTGRGRRQGPPWWKDAVEGAQGWTRSLVASDGSFRAPLPEGTLHADLLLDGRFLYLSGAVQVELDTAMSALVLEPELGACLAVHCLPPPRAADGTRELSGTELRLAGAGSGGGFFGFGAGGMARTIELPAELAADFRGLPAEFTYFLDADPGVFAGQRLLDLRLEPGRVLEREIIFELGARISGVVVDGRGDPIEGADVACELQGQLSRFSPGADREAKSDADGRFELRGVQPRRLKVKAALDGWIPAESAELRAHDGEELGGLRLVLDRGQSIAGSVRYADGSPAPGADVRLQLSDAGNGEGANRELRSAADAEGRFEIAGLEVGRSYNVFASASAPGVDASGDGEDESDAERAWRARSPKVLAGSTAIELRLAEPSGLKGRVFDPEGAPLAKFEVQAKLGESELARSARVVRTIDSADGRFVLPDTFAGEWLVTVEAEGFVSAAEETLVLVPQSGSELRIDMVRACGVEGTVLDPGGSPVAGADVRLSEGGAQRAGPGRGFNFGGPSEETVADGRFAFSELRPGSWRLTASDGEHAPSEPTTVELQAGGTTTDLVLALRAGGTLTGEIYAASGAPETGRSITAMSMTAGDAKGATSDASGRFVIEHLAAGQYMVMAQPDLAKLGELEQQGEELDPINFMSLMKTASVEIPEGGTAHVVLGAPPKNPVRLFGRVTEAGEPVGEGTVMVVSEGRSLLEAWKPARVQPDGNYELVIDEPANVLITYQSRSFEGSGTEFYARIPEVEEYRFDLELPTGRIEGIVLGPDGARLAGERVTIERETGLRGMSAMDGQSGERTDEQGRFAFARLRPATYTLRAGGRTLEENGYGAVVVSGIEVGEGERVEGVRLELPRQGALRGKVLASDGQPIAGASVFVRDGAGRALDPFSSTMTDDQGRFVRTGLAPGEVTVSARADSAASAEVGPVKIREGGETEVELALQEGTVLRVAVEDAAGETMRAALSVRDEAGREQANLRSFASLQADFAEGFSTTEQRVGPLPPGSYVVTVTTTDGRSETRTVKLSGKAERKLRLRIGD